MRGAREIGFSLRGVSRCSTRGQKGNVEFFGFWDRSGRDPGRASEETWIKEAASHENH